MTFSTAKAQFDAVLPSLVNDVHVYLDNIGAPSNVKERITKTLTINVPNGKLFRGLAVPETGLVLLDRSLTAEEFHHLSVLGWLVEMLQAYLLILDDIMDGSTTRRGQPCWYLRPEVGMNAINEACLLKSAIFILLKKHFGTHPSYLSMLESFQEIAFLTETGQECDGLATQQKCPDNWTMEDYQRITLFKGGYYCFYLSVLLGLQYLSLASEANVQQTKDILIPLGQFYQVQNDFLDVFGDTARTGKIGTDIQENKYSWVVIQALRICDDRQRQVICDKYGKLEGENAAEVKTIFESLPLVPMFEAEVEEMFQSLKEKIGNLDESEGLRKGIFLTLLNGICKLHNQNATITQIHGLENFRNVGNFTSQSIRKNIIFRSANLDKIDHHGLKQLHDIYKIQAIFDLRHKSFDSSAQKEPFLDSPIIPTFNTPAMDKFQDGYLQQYFNNLTIDTPSACAGLYLLICSHSTNAFHSLFTYIRDHPSSPFLVNCELGKDRTGVFIAIILLVLGVSDEDIIADYCLSAEGTKLLFPQRKEKIAQLLRGQNVSFTSAALDGHFSALPATMALFLGRFRAVYGGGEGFMRHIGLEIEDVRVIREYLSA